MFDRFRPVRLVMWLVLSGAWCATIASGGGFQVSDFPARAVGMGGAILASIDDGSSMYLNPAGISFLSGTHLSIGASVTLPQFTFTGVAPSTNSYKMSTQVLFPPNVYLCHTFDGGWSAGISASTPYACKTGWDPGWIGGRLAVSGDLRVTFFTPTLSYRVAPGLAVGIGVNLALPHFQYSRRIGFEKIPGYENYTGPDGTLALDGTGELAYGAQAGLLWTPWKSLSLAVASRGTTQAKVGDANATFSGIPDSLRRLFPDGRAKTSWNLPQTISLGAGWSPFYGLHLEADASKTLWSGMKAIEVTVVNSSDSHTYVQQGWKDTFTAKFGAELDIDDVLLRAGYTIDQSPVPDQYLSPYLPDADWQGFSAGIGYRVSEGMDLDFSFMWIQFDNRTVVNSGLEYAVDPVTGAPGYFNGAYTLSATVIGINLKYHWN